MYYQPVHFNHILLLKQLPVEHNHMDCATLAERSATYTIIMIESLKMSATFKVSCIKSCIAPFCSFLHLLCLHCFEVCMALNTKQRINNQKEKQIKLKGRQNSIVPVNCKFGKMSYKTVVSFITSSLSSQILQKRKTVLSFVVVDLGLVGKKLSF